MLRGAVRPSIPIVDNSPNMPKQWSPWRCVRKILSSLRKDRCIFLIIVCVAIYAVLVQNIALDEDVSKAIWTCMGYTVLLCFTLFKTSSMARSIFAAH